MCSDTSGTDKSELVCLSKLGTDIDVYMTDVPMNGDLVVPIQDTMEVDNSNSELAIAVVSASPQGRFQQTHVTVTEVTQIMPQIQTVLLPVSAPSEVVSFNAGINYELETPQPSRSTNGIIAPDRNPITIASVVKQSETWGYMLFGLSLAEAERDPIQMQHTPSFAFLCRRRDTGVLVCPSPARIPLITPDGLHMSTYPNVPPMPQPGTCQGSVE